MVDYTSALLIITGFVMNYLTVYKKNKIVGGILFLTLSLATYFKYPDNAVGAILGIMTFINIMYDIFGKDGNLNPD